MTVIDLLKNRNLAIGFHRETRSKFTMLKHIVNIIFEVITLVFFVSSLPDFIDFLIVITFPFLLILVIFLNIYDFKLRWKIFKDRE